jgi:integrase/recombinase XerD
MFEEIFFPRTAEKHRAAPLADPRARYLRHLKEIGTCRSTLRKCANDHLNLVRLLNPREDDRISIRGIEAAATIWSQPKGRRCDRAATGKARQRFIGHGIDLLRFLGWVDEAKENHHPHHAEVRGFEGWLRIERGLSDATIEDYCRAADHFFF